MIEIFDILKVYGWKGLLLSTILFVAYKIGAEWLKNLTDKARARAIAKKQSRLNMHVFFNAMSYILNVEIHSMSIFPDKPVRRELTKDLMYTALVSMHEIAETMANLDYDNISNAEWMFQNRKLLNEMQTLFLNKCLVKGIPPVVYSKYTDWYFTRLRHMREMVDHIGTNDTYPTPEIKTSTFLLMLNLFITTIMADCVAAMHALNGEITGLSYKSGTIEALHDQAH